MDWVIGESGNWVIGLRDWAIARLNCAIASISQSNYQITRFPNYPIQFHCFVLMIKMWAAVLGDWTMSTPFAISSDPVVAPRTPVSADCTR